MAAKAKQVFMVVAATKAPEVEERLNNLGLPVFKVADNSWLVAHTGTASEAAEEFGMRSQNVVGTGIVVSVNNYAGRASPDAWEWLKLHWPVDG